MKKKIFTLVTILFTGFICLAHFPKYGEDKQARINERNQKIYEVTKKNLSSFLENIPAGFEKQHGFNSRSEFIRATAGPVYAIMGMNEEGKVFDANLFNVPVVVDGEYRAMITVSFVNGSYEIETVGAALLAAELQVLEKEKQSLPDHEKIMLNVYSRTSGFVGYKTANTTINEVNFIPLESAKTALNDLDRSIKPHYKLSELAQALIIE